MTGPGEPGPYKSRLRIRSGRGDGIAPVPPPTPPDMRFSRIRRLARVDFRESNPRDPPGFRRFVIQRCHSQPSPRTLPASPSRLVRRNPPAASPSATALSRPFGRLLERLQSPAVSEVSSRLRPFAPAAFTAFLATMASADFCPPLSGQISPGRVHGLSGRAAGLYLIRLSVTVGFRGS